MLYFSAVFWNFSMETTHRVREDYSSLGYYQLWEGKRQLQSRSVSGHGQDRIVSILLERKDTHRPRSETGWHASSRGRGNPCWNQVWGRVQLVAFAYRSPHIGGDRPQAPHFYPRSVDILLENIRSL